MLRNSMIYRRLWYVRKRNLKRIHILLRLAVATLILFVLLSAINGKLLPHLKQPAERSIHAAVVEIMDDAVNDAVGGGLPGIILTDTDSGQPVLDTLALDKLSDRISGEVSKKLAMTGNNTIAVPLAGIPGDIAQYDTGQGGVCMNLAIRQADEVKTRFLTEPFISGTGRTSLRIDVEVSAVIAYSGTFLSGRTKVNAVIPVKEFVFPQ